MPKDNFDKINKAFTQQVMPLFDVWCKACHLSPIECDILYLKMFDDRHLNEEQIIDILSNKYSYFYCNRAFRKQWKKIKHRIETCLP